MAEHEEKSGSLCTAAGGWECKWCSHFRKQSGISAVKHRSTIVHALCSVLSWVQLWGTVWTVARQAPLSMGFSRQAYWSGLPCLPPGDFPNPGSESRYPALQADSLPSEPPGKPKTGTFFPYLGNITASQLIKYNFRIMLTQFFFFMLLLFFQSKLGSLST